MSAASLPVRQPTPGFPGLTMSYSLWRFLYWQKKVSLGCPFPSYAEIDEQVKQGKIVPNDSQVEGVEE